MGLGPEQGGSVIGPALKRSLSSCPALGQDLTKPFTGEKHQLISELRNPYFGAGRIRGGPAWLSPFFVNDLLGWLYSVGSLFLASFPLSLIIFFFLNMPGSVHVCVDDLSKARKPQMFLVASPQASIVNNDHGHESNSFHL